MKSYIVPTFIPVRLQDTFYLETNYPVSYMYHLEQTVIIWLQKILHTYFQLLTLDEYALFTSKYKPRLLTNQFFNNTRNKLKTHKIILFYWLLLRVKNELFHDNYIKQQVDTWYRYAWWIAPHDVSLLNNPRCYDIMIDHIKLQWVFNLYIYVMEESYLEFVKLQTWINKMESNWKKDIVSTMEKNVETMNTVTIEWLPTKDEEWYSIVTKRVFRTVPYKSTAKDFIDTLEYIYYQEWDVWYIDYENSFTSSFEYDSISQSLSFLDSILSDV